MTVALMACAAKAASGVGLQLAGFSPDALSAPAVPSAATVARTGVIYGPVAGLPGAAAALTCLAYRLNARTHARILATLTAKRRGSITGLERPSPSP